MDLEARTATFDVDGEKVTRPIAQEVTDATLQDHLQALANGLFVEAEEKAATEIVGTITTVPVEVGTEFQYVEPVVEEATEEVVADQTVEPVVETINETITTEQV